jgi:dipeptide/tripeptide permease
LHPPACGDSTSCKSPTPAQLAFLFSAFGLLIIGASGVRPCNFAFGADQFNPHTESGKRGIDSFFNWYFFTYTFAQMVSVTLIVYIQSDISWSIGLAIPAILMFISCAIYFMGSKLYVKIKATGSPLTSVAQVLIACIKKRKLDLSYDQPLFIYIAPNSINSTLPYTDQFKFLDKAAIRTPQDQVNPDQSAGDPWTLCSMQQVEEVKLLLRVLPVWASTIIYLVALTPLHTFAIFQAQQSDRQLFSSNFKIPAATYIVFEMLGLTIFIPIYDRIAVPFLRRITKKEGGITILQRMGIGIFMTLICMLVSGIVEDRRRTIALTMPTLGTMPRRGAISAMSGLWLIPQLAIGGVAEGFATIGQIEFYYKQFPENMKSIAGSLFFCGLAASNYFSTFLITVVHRTTKNAADGNWLPKDLNEGRLDYYYYMIAGLGVLNFGYFLAISKWYNYKETAATGKIQANGEEQI